MPVNNSNLENRNQWWYATVTVPPLLRKHLGSHMRRSLKTKDIRVARHRRDRVVYEFRSEIKNKQKELEHLAQYPEHIQRALELHEYAIKHPEDMDAYDDNYSLKDVIYDEASHLDYEKQPKKADEFYNVAIGNHTPLTKHLEAWLSSCVISEGFKRDHLRAINRFSKWCSTKRDIILIEDIDRRLAGEYIRGDLEQEGLSHATIGKYIGSLSNYWSWLLNYGYIKENCWTGLAPTRRRRDRGGTFAFGDNQYHSDRERPFNDEELLRLFNSSPEQTMQDVMYMAALSGLRINEIYKLTIADCQRDFFRIRDAKSQAGNRSVPIHSQLSDMIERLCGDRNGEEFLITEYRSKGTTSKPSDVMVKRFSRYRKRDDVNVHEVVPDKRRSLVNFHSFRRWFVTKAHEALLEGATGYDQFILADVVGHKRESLGLAMTMGTYAQGNMDKAKTTCVEAVRLPEGIKKPS